MSKQVDGIFKLVWIAFRRMPFLVMTWFALPTIIGFTILLSANSQIWLIDLAAEGLSRRNLSGMASLVLVPAAIYTAAALLKVLVQSIKSVLDKELIERYTFSIQSDITESTMNAPMECFEDAEFHDKLVRARNASKENLLDIFNRLSVIVQMLLDFIFILFVLRRGHWLIPVFALIVSLLTLLQKLWIEIKVQSLNKDLTFEGRLADDLKKDILKHNAIKELRIFGTMNYLVNKWTKLSSKQNNARGEMRRKEIKTGVVFVFMRPASLVVCVYLLIHGLQHGSVTPGIVAVAFQKLIELQILSVRISIPLSKIYLLGVKASYIVEFLSAFKYHKKQSELSASAKAAIRLDGVSFSYPGAKKPSLIDVNLSINQGETIALVGENGAGKTTLVNLLLGLYTPMEGKVCWGEQDYTNIKPEELNKRITAVFQDFMCYELSIRENVGIGNVDKIHDDESIKELLTECGISVISEGKEGLDTPLGRIQESGRELSGGQWQRLAIARAMSKNADMIIFDEPTAALDPNAEMDLFNSFKRLSGGKTAVFVSHRLGWARFADRIIVMDKGRLVESGTHDDLMQKRGKYAQSFTAQASWYG